LWQYLSLLAKGQSSAFRSPKGENHGPLAVLPCKSIVSCSKKSQQFQERGGGGLRSAALSDPARRQCDPISHAQRILGKGEEVDGSSFWSPISESVRRRRGSTATRPRTSSFTGAVPTQPPHSSCGRSASSESSATRPRRAARTWSSSWIASCAYPRGHEVIVYEASRYPLVADPFVLRMPLEQLPDAQVPLLATLVVPPARRPRHDRALTARLGLS
jgi:hypothetical protein